MKVVVTGVAGFLGKALARKLLSDGYEVHGIARRDVPELETLGLRLYKRDITEDLSALAPVFHGAEAIFHVAAKVEMWGPYESFFKTNVVGTRNVLELARAAEIPHFIYTSSPSVVADGKDLNCVDESYPFPSRYEAFYPQTKAQAEHEVLTCNTPALRTIALRPHLIFGPGDVNLVPMILERARQGRLVQVGDGANISDFSYIDDCVAAHLCALKALKEDSPKVSGRAYFISQGDPMKLWSWVNEVLRRSGMSPVQRKVSKPLALFLARIFELSAKLRGGEAVPLFTRFLVSEMATSHYFDITAARELLGYRPQYSMAECFDLTFGSEATRSQQVNG